MKLTIGSCVYFLLFLYFPSFDASPVDEESKVPPQSKLSDSAEKLFEDFDDWKIRDMPQFATSVGNHSYDHLLDDMTEASFQTRRDDCVKFLKRAKELKPEITDEANLINIKILIYDLEMYINSYYLKGFYLAINYREGIHKYTDKLFALMLRNNLEDYDKMISRLNLLPIQIDQIIDLLKAGVENGIVNHQTSLKNLNESLLKFVVTNPVDHPFYAYFVDDFPANFSPEQISNIQEKAKLQIKNGVSPAYEKLRVYITEEYRTRPDIAVTTINNGKAFYDQVIYFHTSTKLTPRQIQDIGFSEVLRIEAEMQKVRAHRRKIWDPLFNN